MWSTVLNCRNKKKGKYVAEYGNQVVGNTWKWESDGV